MLFIIVEERPRIGKERPYPDQVPVVHRSRPLSPQRQQDGTVVGLDAARTLSQLPNRPKLSIYWAAACGGCEIAFINLGEQLLRLADLFELYFCPCLLDTKTKDVEALDDGALRVTLFKGAIRTTENLSMAKLLRRKSELLVAFGSCAHEGCIPGLGNLCSREKILVTAFLNSPSVHNPRLILPAPQHGLPGGEVLTTPELLPRVKTLGQVTDVDYIVPGCPPEPFQIGHVLDTLARPDNLPPGGTVLGAGNSTVCEECTRERGEKRVSAFKRVHEVVADPHTCLLEQGLVCLGPATRSGCGALCPAANMPCIGCYGAPAGVIDQGAKMIAALGSVLDLGDTRGLSEEDIAERARGVLETLPDPVGMLYKFSLPASLLGGRLR